VVSLIKFYQGKTDNFSLNIGYYRVGKARAFIENITSEDLLIEWDVTEVKSITDIYIPKTSSELIDGYILNLQIDEDNVEQIRREFWNHLIWGNFPSLPLLIIIPEKKKVGSVSRVDVLSALSLIRLTDRPWEVFVNEEDVEGKIVNWLKLTCMTFQRGMEKKPLLKKIAKQKKAEST